MRTIHTDLSLRTHDNRIRLPIRPTISLRIREGDRVRLSDGQMEVEAMVELRLGAPLARPDWATLIYADDDLDGDEPDEDRARG
ncbi:MAG: hypothetical protein H6710_12560 [Myxococcales bacterium]|nr:hypothetical protein [Myxococcales bacterium]MCB9705244.1 hypothetical protein [Myxococcales bacterium]